MITPGTPVVFDINVLIDAIDKESRSRRDAVLALVNDNELVPYIAAPMVRTLQHKLQEFGVDAAKIDGYLEYLFDPEDGLGFQLISDVVVTDRGIRDRNGNADYEDAAVACSIDAVEKIAGRKALFVTSDIGFAEWCHENERPVLRPGQLSAWTRMPAQPEKLSSLKYVGDHMPRLDKTRRLRMHIEADKAVDRAKQKAAHRISTEPEAAAPTAGTDDARTRAADASARVTAACAGSDPDRADNRT